ncbi:MAG: hypothetical protein ACD_40C00152G0001 [uncultured bacterium]|nr:MAG: hypothetical protein ACD_40C00152G0001 [uncultured bacterium]
MGMYQIPLRMIVCESVCSGFSKIVAVNLTLDSGVQLDGKGLCKLTHRSPNRLINTKTIFNLVIHRLRNLGFTN